MKERSGYDASLFYGDTRYVTTLTDESGNKQVNTKASDTAINTVLKSGKEYHDSNIDILGTRYVGCYSPIYQTGTKDIIGMLFIGKSYEDVAEEHWQEYLLCKTD